ncbi:hypothetical protein [Flagellimonas sp.]|uniref:hypothetical protein n=1 Tax=Flagellimonas sp. TaxID=2058762 RepID=UPI003BA992F5
MSRRFQSLRRGSYPKQLEKEVLEALETGTETQSSLKNFAFCLVTVLVAVTFLLHIYLPHPTREVARAQTERDKVRNKIELLKDSLVQMAIKENQLMAVRMSNLIAQEEEAHVEFLRMRHEASIFGFHSPHKFLYHFGIGLVLLVLALDMLRTLIYFKGVHRKARTFGAFTALTIAGYQMAWIFYVNDDLPKLLYLHILLVIGVLSGTTGIFIAQVKRRNIQWLKYHVLVILTELKTVHIKEIFKIAINGNPNNEIYQQDLKKSSQKISNKMQEHADEILKY